MIYEDALITISYPEKGVVNGHIVIEPKNSVETTDDLDEETMTQLSFAANYAATVLFETLGAQGTNIILNENPVRYDVIARSAEDGWQHQWTPVSVDASAMDDAAQRINANTPLEEPMKPEPRVEEPQAENVNSIEELEEQENQMIRQLTRIP